MTRQEILEYHRTLTFLCRGYLPVKARYLVEELIKNGDADFAGLIDGANRGRTEDEPFVHTVVKQDHPRYPVLMLLSDGTSEPYVRRPMCGYNFVRTILAGPWDGKDHEYTCPQCGVRGEYRAPLLTGE